MIIKSFLDVTEDKRTPLDEGGSKVFLECCFADIHKSIEFDEGTAKQHPLMNLFYKRLKWAKVPVSLGLGIFIAYMCKTPGIAVLWAYTLKKMHQKHDKMLTTTELSYSFPLGFPTEDAMHEIWEGQKGHAHGLECDNILDSSLEVWGLEEEK